MNFIKITLILMLFSNTAFGQWQWARTATGDTSYTVQPAVQYHSTYTDAAGNTYITGNSLNYAASFGGVKLSNQGYFVVKYDASGSAQWARQASGTSKGMDVVADASGNVYVLGTFKISATFGSFVLSGVGTKDVMFLVKYDANGNEQWVRSASSTGSLAALSIAADPAGEIVIAGSYQSGPLTIGSFTLPTFTGNTLFLVKYDSNGNVQWARSATGLVALFSRQNIAINALGEIYIGGNFATTISIGNCATCTASAPLTTSSNIYFAKFDPAGSPLWVKAAAGTGNDVINDLAVDKDGGFYATGFFSGASISFDSHVLPQPNQVSFFVVRYDSSGSALWAKTPVKDGLLSSGSAIVVDTAGDAYIAGYYEDSLSFGSNTMYVTGMSDFFIVKYNATGVPTWAITEGTSKNDWAAGIGIDGSGNIYTAGGFEDTTLSIGGITLHSQINYNDFLAKYAPNGSTLWATKSASVHFSNHTDAWAKNVVTDGVGNVYVAGGYYQKTIGFASYILSNRDTTGNSSDIYLVKYSTTGAVIYAKSIGSNGWDYNGSMAVDPQGNIYVAGTFVGAEISAGGAPFAYNNAAGTEDGFLVKFDPAGNEVWGNGVAGTGEVTLFGLAADNSGNVLVTGRFTDNLSVGSHVLTTSGSVRNMFLVKYDGAGVALWAKQGKSSFNSYGLDVTTDGAGNSSVCGVFSEDISFGQSTGFTVQGAAAFLVKYDEFGNPQMAIIPPGLFAGMQNVESDDAGNVYTARGDTLTKYDPSLNVLWKRGFGTGQITGITTTPAGNTFVTGAFNSDSLVTGNNTIFRYGSASAFAAMCDAAGYIPWARGVAGWSSGNGISVDNASNVFVAGSFQSPDGLVMGPDTLRSYLSGNMFVGSLGNPLDVGEVVKQTSSVTIYPNPFNESTTLKLEMAVRNATLILSNVVGKKVRQVGGLTGHTIILSRRDLPPGIYFFSLLEAGRNVASGKLVVTD